MARQGTQGKGRKARDARQETQGKRRKGRHQGTASRQGIKARHQGKDARDGIKARHQGKAGRRTAEAAKWRSIVIQFLKEC
jgi:predicted membrane metal-binding protein